MKNPALSPTVTALLSVLLFSTGGLVIKWMPLSPLPLAGLRALCAAVFLGIYIKANHPELRLASFRPVACLAIVSYVVMTVCYVYAMKLTTAASAIFLQYTMPAWVLIGGALWLKERITASRLATIALCLVGMVLFFLDELEPQQWQGNLIALVSGIGFAGVVLAIRREREHNPIRSVFWGNLVTALIVLPAVFIYDASLYAEVRPAESMLGLLWLGIFQMGLAYIFYVRAISHLPAIEVAILSLIEPVLNPTWVYLVQGETPSFWSIVGGCLILTAVLVRSVYTEAVEEKIEA